MKLTPQFESSRNSHDVINRTVKNEQLHKSYFVPLNIFRYVDAESNFITIQVKEKEKDYIYRHKDNTVWRSIEELRKYVRGRVEVGG